MTFGDFFKKERIREWLVRNAEGKQATVVLFGLSFLESIFFPIPPDFILMTILAARRDMRWAFFSAITTISSMLGGVLMYFIGSAFFEVFGHKIIAFYHLTDKFDAMAAALNHHTFLAMFVAASLPIPESYKVAAMAGGFFHVDLPAFILASILGRGARFFLVGYAMKLFGHKIAHHVYKHLHLVTIFCSIILVALIILLVK
jgi:membrane protein YqaA with SNARE-associated domain